MIWRCEDWVIPRFSYTAHMKPHQRPPKLDVKHAGQSSQQLAGQDVLTNYERLMEETQGLGEANVLNWTARGALQPDANGQPQPWLFLDVSTILPLTCQRCLGPVDVPVQIERAFRFVETEAQAEQEAWERASEKIENSITDALMRGFESGKGFFQSLWNTIKNTLNCNRGCF